MTEWESFWHSFWAVLAGKLALPIILGLLAIALIALGAVRERIWEWIYTRYWKRKGVTVEKPNRPQ